MHFVPSMRLVFAGDTTDTDTSASARSWEAVIRDEFRDNKACTVSKSYVDITIGLFLYQCDRAADFNMGPWRCRELRHGHVVVAAACGIRLAVPATEPESKQDTERDR
jgi:hypothetical protein